MKVSGDEELAISCAVGEGGVGVMDLLDDGGEVYSLMNLLVSLSFARSALFLGFIGDANLFPIPYWRVIRRMRLYFHRKEICAYT